uniref:Uncharacterized protein n=1 Tax=Molossus molossus TaxID=27622 RepID=A0A7J8E2K2_MOLMO|nr:hypothetical protein HJG59_009030 [Molossus molossus]
MPRTHCAFLPPSLSSCSFLSWRTFFSWQIPAYSSNWYHLPLMLSLMHPSLLSALPLASTIIALGMFFLDLSRECLSSLWLLLRSLRGESMAHRLQLASPHPTLNILLSFFFQSSPKDTFFPFIFS